MHSPLAILEYVNTFLWGPFTLFLIVMTGLYLMYGLAFFPVRKIVYAMKLLVQKGGRKEKGKGAISPYGALMTAISGAVGTGNIAGVATAIFLGGPGALFYMWLTALVGMATSYTEAACAINYRVKDTGHHHIGGPMFYIKRGVGRKYPVLASILASVYAAFAALATLVVGNMIQINSIADIAMESLGVNPIMTGTGMAILVGVVLIGGVQRIAEVAGCLVPLMVIGYVGSGLFVLAAHYDRIWGVLLLIVQEAFRPAAVGGGVIGAGMAAAIRYGVARGVLSNEAGMGTMAIVHAAAATKDPVSQGHIAMLGVFIDTIVVCTITGLVILVTDGYHLGDTGAVLTGKSFGLAIPSGIHIVTVALCVFAFSTMIGYSYYGEKSAQYLLGQWVVFPYRLLWVVLIPFGAVFKLDLVWSLAEALMAFIILPNLVGLIILGPEVFKMTLRYWHSKKD